MKTINLKNYRLSNLSIEEKRKLLQLIFEDDTEGIKSFLASRLMIESGVWIYENEKECKELEELANKLISKYHPENKSLSIFLPHNNREPKPTYNHLRVLI